MLDHLDHCCYALPIASYVVRAMLLSLAPNTVGSANAGTK